MTNTEFDPDALRAALAEADKGIRLDWITILFSCAMNVLLITVALRIGDFANATHVLVVVAALFVVVQMHFVLATFASRQNAHNARMLRALELLDQRLGTR